MQAQTLMEPAVVTDASGFAVVPITLQVEPIDPVADYSYGYFGFFSDYGYEDDSPVLPSVGLAVMATTEENDRVFLDLRRLSFGGSGPLAFLGPGASMVADREVAAEGPRLPPALGLTLSSPLVRTLSMMSREYRCSYTFAVRFCLLQPQRGNEPRRACRAEPLPFWLCTHTCQRSHPNRGLPIRVRFVWLSNPMHPPRDRGHRPDVWLLLRNVRPHCRHPRPDWHRRHPLHLGHLLIGTERHGLQPRACADRRIHECYCDRAAAGRSAER